MIRVPADQRRPTRELTADIEHLTQLASAVLNEHTNEHGLCAACGSAFPCDRAVLAEHNLAVCGCLHDGRAGAGEPPNSPALALSTS
jgi:hypothetical protein